MAVAARGGEGGRRGEPAAARRGRGRGRAGERAGPRGAPASRRGGLHPEPRAGAGRGAAAAEQQRHLQTLGPAGRHGAGGQPVTTVNTRL